MIVVRKEEAADELARFAGRRFAYNSEESFSGFVVLRAAMRDAGIDPNQAAWVETGSHRGSIKAVASGLADIGAIDAVCWALALRYDGESVAKLKVIGATPLRPGLPLITAVERSDAEVRTIRDVFQAAVDDPQTKSAREALQIGGIRSMDEWDYVPIAALARRS
jgi:ABC-type phosphate/phosphonate transport system substrate-binding protein